MFEHGIRFGDLGSAFWPGGHFWSKKWDPENSAVVMVFCHDNSGESLRPKSILWSLGPIWAGYFAAQIVFSVFSMDFLFSRKIGAGTLSTEDLIVP